MSMHIVIVVSCKFALFCKNIMSLARSLPRGMGREGNGTEFMRGMELHKM